VQIHRLLRSNSPGATRLHKITHSLVPNSINKIIPITKIFTIFSVLFNILTPHGPKVKPQSIQKPTLLSICSIAIEKQKAAAPRLIYPAN